MLSVRSLKAGYDPIQVLRGVDIDVPEGRVVALIGPNGVGKTTTLRAISGLIRPWDGEVHFDGRRIDALDGDEIARIGLVHVPEGRGVLPQLTVAENLKLGTYPVRRDKERVERGIERVQGMFPILKERSEQLAASLSGGEQQMLVIARALASSPRLIMIDEMSLGLAPLIVQGLFDTVRELRSEGVTILLVEQYIHLALEVADYLYVLEKGMVSTSGTPQELVGNEAALRSAYLGSTADVGSDGDGGRGREGAGTEAKGKDDDNES